MRRYDTPMSQSLPALEHYWTEIDPTESKTKHRNQEWLVSTGKDRTTVAHVHNPKGNTWKVSAWPRRHNIEIALTVTITGSNQLAMARDLAEAAMLLGEAGYVPTHTSDIP